MALVLADRVLETTTSTGSGTITLAGAEPGYQSFAVVGNANQTYYTITGDTEWEVGIGTYTSSGTTLSRDTVLSSSASGAKVTFSAGQKKVFVTYPSEKSVNFDVSGNISVSSAIITNVAEPIVGSDAATKLYVDTLAAQGISYHEPVKYEVPNTTGNLVATYNNGTAGVSATLTNAGSLVPFVPDGVTASISDRVLVYNQTNAYENGVYVVSTVGNGSTAWVLTRAADADTYGVKSPTELGGGDAFFVTSGNTGAGETYICNNASVIIFGSTAITFAQISSAQVYQAGNGISLTNTTISLATPVTVANGGTGLSTAPTNGQLLIGNGSNYTLSTLTAGSGVSITNSAGSITLSATNSGAVTSVTATGPLTSSGGTTPDISIANSTGTGSVVLDQGATISSATITAAVSASITTITGTSANITTVTGTTTTFSSGTISQLGATSATIATLSGTNVTYSSGTVSQLAATSATIASVSGTNVTYSNGNLTSATVTTISGTTATYTSATVTNLALTSLTLSNLSIASATISSGNLAFTGTAQRITGDMSNATIANRLAFQNSVTNTQTAVVALPNGTSPQSQFMAFGASDGVNTNVGVLINTGSEVGVRSNITGTGTYLPMTFYTGGSERVRIDTSGNVGIGASPSFLLDVSNTSTAVDYISGRYISSAAASGESRTWLKVEKGSNYGGAIAGYLSQGVGSGLIFGTQNATSTPVERMRITNDGNVGIGTTTPTNSAGYSTLSLNGSTGGQLVFQTGGTYRHTIYSSTTDLNILNGQAGSLTFGTNNAVRMTIDSSGNVGIGGTAQAYTKLQLTGTLPTSGGSSVGSWVTGTIPSGTTGDYIGFWSESSTQAASFTLARANHFYTSGLGVGAGSTVTNQYGFRVASTFTAATNNYGFYSDIASGSNRWNFYAAGTAQNYFAGNVGVKTTSIGASLEVVTQSAGPVPLRVSHPGNTTFGTIIQVRTTAGTDDPYISWENYNGGSPVRYGISCTDSGAMAFMAGAYEGGFGTERARISSAGGLSVGTTADPGSGGIFATANITAYYSDARLKDFKGKIGDALNKVSQLNGYYYTENQKAEEFGYNNKELQVGVSAQEVKAVLPEVVTPAPFDLDADGKSKSGDDYMTVRYEKLVPLLIEAIKELKAEVEALKAAK